MQVAVALGIADNSITHCVSYTDSTSRSFEIDRLTYKILDMVLHNASDFCSIPQPLRSLQNVLHGDWEEDMRE